MAKKNSIEDALNEVFKNIDVIVQDTVKESGKKARRDMKQKAKEVVKHYYDEYSERKFEPAYSLYKSFETYDRTRNNVINVGVEFMPSRIEGKTHKSNSRWHQEGHPWESIDWFEGPEKGKQYGVVDTEYIIDNFWEGIHPKALGNKYIGFYVENVRKGKSPEQLFAEYVEEYTENTLKPFVIDTFTQKILQSLIK